MSAPMWSETAVRHLLDSVTCPVCATPNLRDGRCAHCGADLSGSISGELWTASQAAATALLARQAVLERVPRIPVPAAVPAVATAVPATATGPAPLPPPAAPSRSSATVQSVLAVAGAGLFAIAAIVFTYVNPDLTDQTVRSVIVAAVTVVFLIGARLLARRGLQFSAEAVGALGLVFLAIDVSAFADLTPAGLSPWVFAAIGTAIAGAAMCALAALFRIRVWLFLSFAALALVPAMLGLAADTRLAAIVGCLGSGAAAFALFQAAGPFAARFANGLRPERILLTVLQFGAVATVAVAAPGIELVSTGAYWGTIAALLAGVAVLALAATAQLLPRVWSAIAGATSTAALVALSFVFFSDAAPWAWTLLIAPAVAVLAANLLGIVLPLPRTASRRIVAAGALGVAGVAALIPLASSLGTGAAALLAEAEFPLVDAPAVLFDILGLAAIAIGLGAYAAATRTRWIGELAAWFAVASALTVVSNPAVVSDPAIALAVRIGLGLALAVAASAALAFVPALRRAVAGFRLPLIVGAHLALVLGVVLSWRGDTVGAAWLAVWTGAPVIMAIAAVAFTIPRGARFVHVGIGYAYALLVFSTALELGGVDPVPMLCLTTSAGAVGAIAATFLRRIGPRAWWSILTVTSVPFVIGVAQVVFERSGWTALSTGLIFLLALALVITRRPGLGIPLRAIAAGLLVPSLAVVVVCLGAQVLVDSGSPVVLPVIAAIVAMVLPSTGLIRTALVRHGIEGTDAAAARLAIEGSALLTGAIAVGLGLVREAAGLGTTFVVLLILGLGAIATAVWAGRRYGWWAAGAAFTGALWCVWGMAEVDVLEPYLLPPAVAAAVVGAVLTGRGRAGVRLYAAGVGIAVVPVLVLLAVQGTPAPTPWRAYGLVAASWVLVLVGALFGRRFPSLSRDALRSLRLPTLAVAIVAGAAGAVQGLRLGTGVDAAPDAMRLIIVCAAISFLGAVPAFAAARAFSSGWAFAPAALYLAAGTWTAIDRDWFTIWAMWTVMLGYLVAVVVRAARLRAAHPPRGLPVWFLFALAFVTAVVAWSPRDLRVEWFSLPLGAALLIAGALHLRRGEAPPRIADAATATANSWPARWAGSWPLLLPGLVVTFSASVTATFTDPQTWRAILVIVIALGAILVGASLRLAAPFLVGIVVLPIENVLVFLVQIGRGVASMPWWITLAVVGAVLLIIAVTYERGARSGSTRQARGAGARLRDLA